MGFATKSDKLALEAVLRKAIRWGYYSAGQPSLEMIFKKSDDKLFKTILAENSHVLHQFLPPEKTHGYGLRARAHNRQLPKKALCLKRILFCAFSMSIKFGLG